MLFESATASPVSGVAIIVGLSIFLAWLRLNRACYHQIRCLHPRVCVILRAKRDAKSLIRNFNIEGVRICLTSRRHAECLTKLENLFYRFCWLFSSCQHSAAVHPRSGTGHGMCYWSFLCQWHWLWYLAACPRAVSHHGRHYRLCWHLIDSVDATLLNSPRGQAAEYQKPGAAGSSMTAIPCQPEQMNTARKTGK